MAGKILWVAAAYAVGTFPTTLVIAKRRRATGLLVAARRGAGETDAHILMTKHLGSKWATLAMAADVGKAALYAVAARRLGGLPSAWLAPIGVLLVVGHSFPFYARQTAGRGMAAAAGVLLVLLPVEMVIAGGVIALGLAAGNSGVATTLAMAGVPIAAVVQGQPREFVAMAVAIFAVIIARRIEGVGQVVRSGVPRFRAILYRCLFDSSGLSANGPSLRHRQA